MQGFILSAVPLMASVLFYFTSTVIETTLPGNATIVSGHLSLICLAISACIIFGNVFSILTARGEQFKNFEKLEEHLNKIKILKLNRDNLINSLKLHVIQYVDLEKEIFKNISLENISSYFVSYPELKSSDVITGLMEQITRSESAIYSEETSVEYVHTRIRIARTNPWLISSMIPDLSDEVKTKIENRFDNTNDTESKS